MPQAIVFDAAGQLLTPCSVEKARRMIAEGKAALLAESPLTIQLPYPVTWTADPGQLNEDAKPGKGKCLLLHICCGPCGTYSIQRLREQGFAVTGFWYNPNIHPYAEHERRRECVRAYSEEIGLPMLWVDEYDMPAYFRAVAGHETFGERCPLCYHLRLERAAQVACTERFDAFTTTLLISPYQQQATIHRLGEELAHQHGLSFYFENLRRGWSERGKMAREQEMYQQHYCGCLYSEWESVHPGAAFAAPSIGSYKSVRSEDK